MAHQRTFAPAFDIWSVPSYLRKHIQPGQWVYAGDRSNMGQYLGQSKGGADVVAWKGNFRAGKKNAYIKALRAYTKG